MPTSTAMSFILAKGTARSREKPEAHEESPARSLQGICAASLAMAVKAAKAADMKMREPLSSCLMTWTTLFYGNEYKNQVEHPVTEMVTGIDIIKEQIRIAAGNRLSFRQKDIEFRGHAIECRINAENPEKGFMPSPGYVNNVLFPGGFGVRIDSALYTGYFIPPCYDSMIAKIIVHGRDRSEAISRMKRALSELVIDGADTNADFHIIFWNMRKSCQGGIIPESLNPY